MKAHFFKNEIEFRKWLEKNHENETELLVGYYKVNSNKESMTWSQSVDQALCFGWIDGVRKSIDEESYCIRFTPRKTTSIWSAVNIQKIENLMKLGLMQPAGIKIFASRKEHKSKVYTYENEEVMLTSAFEIEFQKNKKAWDYFLTLAPSYRKSSTNWVMSAKLESTRLKRLNQLIAESEALTNQWKDNKYSKK